METRANHVWVGAVTLVILAALAVFIIWIEFRFALRITVGAFVAVGAYAFFLNRLKSKGATQ